MIIADSILGLLKRSAISNLAVTLCTLTTACFDPRTMELEKDAGTPKRLLIDDFEDHDNVPSNSEFEQWQCVQVNVVEDQWQFFGCGLTPLGQGSLSNYAYSMEFSLTDENNDVIEHPATQLLTNRAVPMDTRRYQHFVFDARVVPGDLSLPENTEILVYLNCLELDPSPEVNYAYYIDSSVRLTTTEWQTYVLPIDSFGQYGWGREDTPIDEQACAAAIDVVKFELHPNLRNGASTNGTVMFDNVYLE